MSQQFIYGTDLACKCQSCQQCQVQLLKKQPLQELKANLAHETISKLSRVSIIRSHVMPIKTGFLFITHCTYWLAISMVWVQNSQLPTLLVFYLASTIIFHPIGHILL